MARQEINIGGAIADPVADTARAAFQKVNENFAELYGSVVSETDLTQDATHNRSKILMSGDDLTFTLSNGLAIETGVPFVVIQNGDNLTIDGAAVNLTATTTLENVDGSFYYFVKTGSTTGTDNYIVTQLGVGEANTIDSVTSGEPSGSDQVLNVVSLTQAEYDAGTPVATTFYIITDA